MALSIEANGSDGSWVSLPFAQQCSVASNWLVAALPRYTQAALQAGDRM
jgi:hypothetical protein